MYEAWFSDKQQISHPHSMKITPDMLYTRTVLTIELDLTMAVKTLCE